MAETDLINKLKQVIETLYRVRKLKRLPDDEGCDRIIKNLIDLFLLIPDSAMESLQHLLHDYIPADNRAELLTHLNQYQGKGRNPQSIIKQINEILTEVDEVGQRDYIAELYQRIEHAKSWAMNEKEYLAALPIVEILHGVARNGVVEEQAYKLSRLFGSANNIIEYLQYFAEAHQTKSENLLHDACLYSLPDSGYDVNVWRELAMKHHHNQLFFTLLPNCDVIERQIKIHAGSKSIDHEHIQKLEKKITQLREKGKSIKRAQTDLIKACRGMAFDRNISLEALEAFNQAYKQAIFYSLEYFLDHGLSKRNFHTYINLMRQDDDSLIPNLTITAQDVGYSDQIKFYLMKVPVLDDHQATRAACLGKLTHCNQSISGEAGETCAIHGLTSVYGGFYVLCAGDAKKPKVEDPVVAQAWAWRSRNDAIVFDSIEIDNAIKHEFIESANETYTLMTRRMFLELAEQLLLNGFTHHVAVGAGSGIQRKLEDSPLHLSLPRERFIDYDGFNDSEDQIPFVHMTPGGYILYESSSKHAKDFAQINTELMSRLLEVSTLYFNNYELLEIIESVLKLKGKKGQVIIDEMLDIAKSFGRSNEFKTMLNKITHVKEALQNSYALTDLHQLIETDPALINITIEGESALTRAIKEKDEDMALEFIRMGANIHLLDEKMQTPLLLATNAGLTDVVETLLKRGADVSHVSDENFNAMEILPAKNRREIWDLFINHGEQLRNLHDPNVSLLSQLLESIKYVSTEDLHDVTFLLKYGIDPTINGKRNEPLINQALHKALTSNKQRQENALRVTLALVKAGADLNRIGENGDTPLMTAIRYTGGDNGLRQQILDAMLEHKNIDINICKRENGNNALNVAIHAGDEKLAIKLVEAGSKLNVTERGLEYPTIMLAIQNNMPKLAMMLVDAGADLKYKDETNKSLLMYAIDHVEQDHYPELIKQLIISHKVDLNEQTHQGMTALHQSIDKDALDIMQCLAQNGADMNRKNIEGDTPMHHAIKCRKQPFAMELITLGAFIAVSNNEGLIPVDLARQAGLAYVVEYLEKPYDVPQSWIEATNRKYQQSVNLDKEEQKQIKEWIKEDNLKMLINHILQNEEFHRAYITYQDHQCTLLMYACLHGAINIAKWLIRLSTDVNAKDSNGQTLISYAIKGPHAHQLEMLKLLRQHRVELDISSLDGKMLDEDVAKFIIIWHLSKNPLKNLQRIYTHDLILEYIQYDEANKMINILKNNRVVMDSCVVEQDLNECTMLMYACKQGSVLCVKQLIENRANVNLIDHHGNTALDYALSNNSKNQLEVLKLLRFAKCEYPVGKYNPNDYSEAVAHFLADWQQS